MPLICWKFSRDGEIALAELADDQYSSKTETSKKETKSMITSIFFATELLLLQHSVGGTLAVEQTQDAVLVVREKTTRGEPEQLSVSIPTSEPETRLVSLNELRAMVQQTEQTIQNPIMSFVVDQTIGGQPKGKDGFDGEGGIAGSQPFDLQFMVTSGSLIPPTQAVEFANAIAAVESYIESQISSVNVTIRLQLAYVPLTVGRLGVTTARYSIEKYSDFSNALAAEVLGESEVASLPVRSTLPIRYSGVSTSATPENRVFVVRPLKIALGLPDPSGPGSILDEGTITMNSAIQWDFDPSNGLKFGQSLLYSFQDHLIREVVQTMGFVAGADFLVRDCTVMDIFRFQQDVIDVSYLVTNPANVFGGAPPVTCTAFSTFFEGGMVTGAQFQGWALDYNPGLNKTLIANAAGFGITPAQMLTGAGADSSNPLLFLQNQMAGTGAGNTNSFDDSDMVAPAVAAAQRTNAYPDGAVQTIVTVGGRCVVVDFRGKVPAVSGPPALLQINNDFLGAMPRTVARNSVANKSILNFPYGTSGQEFDFEMEMYDGSPIRGAFVKQNELGDLGTRCLMGQSIGKGNTFYSRDYCSYTQTPLALVPLGVRPDFLTKREWLALDAMGWSIDMAALDATNEGDTSVTLTCP